MGELVRRVWGVASRTAGNTIAPGVATLCTLAGIPIGESTALGALAGSLTEEGVALVGQLHRDRAERVARFAETVAEEAGCTLDELLAEAARYPEKLELLAQAVEGASRSLSDEKVDVLARMVAGGICDDARVDETIIMLDVVHTLELPHLLLLALLTKRQQMPNNDPAPSRWTEGEVLKELPTLHGALDGVAAKLQGLAMVYLSTDDNTRPATRYWELTRFGQACAEYLSERPARPETE